MQVGRIASTIGFGLALASGGAQAANVQDLFQQFGLYGDWAVDCSHAATRENSRIKVVKSNDGLVSEDSDQGPDYEHNHYTDVSAERLSDTQLSVQVIFEPGTRSEQRQTLIYLVHDGTWRTMFNQPQGGAVLVKDGIMVGSGNPTPVLNKCN